ncbi:MAG TPA: ATP-binding protein [Polyangiaceae bacterium]|jgi:PAS domain S-box-containing protein
MTDSEITADLTAAGSLSWDSFRHLVESVSDYAIFMLDATGHVATWNLGAAKIKGYAASEIIGQHFSKFYPAEDIAAGKPERELAEVRETGRTEDEGWRIRKDGSRFWANVTISALRNSEGALVGYAKVTRDLTERRQAEETQHRLWQEQAARAAAEAVASKAEHANRIKDEFLATVSHELRTPLNAIVGWASLLRQQRLAPQIAKAVEVIDRNAQAQVKIIEDILDVSRIITGKLRLEPKPTDLVAVARQAIEVIRTSAMAKEISVELESSKPSQFLIADAERLQQVIWNLLSNAVKFTDPQGRIRIGIRQEASHLLVSVSDSGRGIDLDFLPYVFDRFKQADASTTRRVGGLGLGLALVRHIVELHGGSVSVESDGPGKGSTFNLVLPLRAVVQEEPTAILLAPTPEGSAAIGDELSGVRVLVVEDDADTRDLLVAVLKRARALVETANSAERGFRKLVRFQPHVLVSDIGMAGEDGYSLIRRVRALAMAEGGGVPSIALTAYASAHDRDKALAAGFTTHLGKPVKLDDLLSTIANLGVAAASPAS